jgi:chemotaxis protein MotB
MSRKLQRSRVSHERWLVSYADFITLLFAFFVVLYAFAKADQKKQVQVSAAIDSAFRSLSIASSLNRSGPNDVRSHARASAVAGSLTTEFVSPKRVQADLEQIQRDLERRLSAQIAHSTVSIELSRDGLVISLREAGFFNSGSAIPRPETEVTLHQIAESLAGTPYDVRVEGHTDTVPIHSAEFDSNWELSSARATHIARILLKICTIPPQQISAAGYAEYHPIASNDTAEGRAKNRRVDLVVMPRAVLNLSLPDTVEDKTGWRKIADQ